MICERCKKKEASIFYEETINGATSSYSLCAECTAELKKNGELSGILSLPYISSLQNGFFGGLFGGHQVEESTKELCPLCGSTYNDLQKTGKIGCSECYNIFGEKLKSSIYSIHGNVKHIGRAPSKFRSSREMEKKLSELRSRLKAAVSEENFELAANLRDEIKALEANK